MAESKPTLGYWDIRGLAHPIRALLAYLGVEFEDKHYSLVKEGEGYSPKQWINEKFSLGLDFPNLPYYIDDQIKLTETNAILRHICRRHRQDMLGRDDVEMAKVDMLASVIADKKSSITMICYNPDFSNLIGPALEKNTQALEMFAQFLGENQYLIGDQPTYVDFTFFEYLEMIEEHSPGILDKFSPKFKQYIDRIRALDRVRDFYDNNKLPWNNKIAKWGGELQQSSQEESKSS